MFLKIIMALSFFYLSLFGVDADKYTFEISGDYTLQLIEKESSKVIKSYELDYRPYFCDEQEGECVGTGLRTLSFQGQKYPYALINSIYGAHSKILGIYDFNQKDSIEAKYLGSYGIDYKVHDTFISIIYDDYCSYPNCPDYHIEFYHPVFKEYNYFTSGNEKEKLDDLVAFCKEYKEDWEQRYEIQLKASQALQIEAKKIKSYLVQKGINEENISLHVSKEKSEKISFKIVPKE